MKVNAEPVSDAIVPVDSQHQDTRRESTDGLVAVKIEQDDGGSRRNAKKGEGMNPLDVSKMLGMLKKRTKAKDR